MAVMKSIIKSTCGFCYTGCGILVHRDKDKVVKITGDPGSPVNMGKLCTKALASIEYLYHPDRLKYPLKRMGKKGEGKWQRISWDEAITITANELMEAKDRYGAESVAYIQGAAKGLQDSYGERLANVFGTPNFSTTGHVCFAPRTYASIFTYGFNAVPDYDFTPACLIAWGANMAETRIGEHEQTLQAIKKGSCLIVIDPRETKLAEKAHMWLRLKPGSDLALILGMINVIINENLVDTGFIKHRTIGFDKLTTHMQQYTPKKMAKLTWLTEKQIREAARLYAGSRPAAIQWGNALDQTVDSFQTARAIAILRAITGNAGRPGGDVLAKLGLLEWTSSELVARDKLPDKQWWKRLNAAEPLIPEFRRVPSPYIVKAILEGRPYPLRRAFIQGANPLLTYSNAGQAFSAFSKLEFLVAVDHFMTPTAALADIVLPAATYLEFDNIVAPPYYPVAQVQQKAVSVAECRSDYEIINDLVRKMGLEKHFWPDAESFLDYILKPIGLTFAEFKERGCISGEKYYREQKADYFKTASGKVELYSEQLRHLGFDPLPTLHEKKHQPGDTDPTKEYPLILTTFKSEHYRHSSGRQIPTLRERCPDSLVTLHPDTAAKLAIKEGEWVWIATRQGKINQKVKLSSGIDPRVVIATYGHWYPEKGASALFGWNEANVNLLTDDQPPFNREMGSTHLRGLPCKIYKTSETGVS